MILTRAPFRISFAGGGSDLSAYYKREIGCVLSTSIDKYMYIAIHPYFHSDKIFLKYSKTEIVDRFKNIRHPICKQILSDHQLTGIDITSIADIPAGTGLGSSSSYTVAVLNAVYAYKNEHVDADKLAKEACAIEIEKLGEPIGKQDQYAAAYGGLNLIEFFDDETVNVSKIVMNPEKKQQLQNNLFMIYTGRDHSARDLLKEQGQVTVSQKEKFANIKEMVRLAHKLKGTLTENNIDGVGEILHEGWLLKKSLVKSISNSFIDTIYQQGLAAGANGGKLLGAGAGGFILFYVEEKNHEQFRNMMSEYKELKFSFDDFGAKVIYLGPKFSWREH